MEHIISRVAQTDDYPELAEWLVQMSKAPEQQCLHSWSGQSAEGLQQELMNYWDESELCYVLALRDGRLIGAMGSEYDEKLKRAWLHGPHAGTEDWGAITGQLFTRLLAELPTCIRQLDAYLNVENTRGRRFYTQQGFKESQHLSCDFWLTSNQRFVPDDGGCIVLGKEHETSFKRLYEALFPAAYYIQCGAANTHDRADSPGPRCGGGEGGPRLCSGKCRGESVSGRDTVYRGA
jgi:hypothetical protein